MCLSEATIDLMFDLPAQALANSYSSLMANNSLETEVVSLLDRPSANDTTQISQLENTVKAA